jgi:N6-adenosine-specific RNA methylase IME4
VSTLPRGPFGTVLADPPWEFENRGTRAAAEDHYSTMSAVEIAALPVQRSCAPSAHLYLWTTDTHLLDGSAALVCRAWGFVPKLTIPWVKTKAGVVVIDDVPHVALDPDRVDPRLQIGLGNYFRHAHELVVFAVRGRAPAAVHNLPTVLFAPRGQHSRKPDRLYNWGEQLSPGPRLELFARRARAGWSAWGLEAPRENAA